MEKMKLYKKLYGDTITTTEKQQEILTPEAIGRSGDILVNVVGFQIINEGKTNIEIQINGGNIVPIMSNTGIDMGSDSVTSCIVHTKGAKVTWMCKGW
ncbi:hypothetical protein [Clostridium perfringens]|uniref:hypothetical protein n=1 Tax=Clostridium perfringens TaxID=1502 RepID=UPI000F546FFA|nr:hypothetical protein [Clostridium perfringens]